MRRARCIAIQTARLVKISVIVIIRNETPKMVDTSEYPVIVGQEAG